MAIVLSFQSTKLWSILIPWLWMMLLLSLHITASRLNRFDSVIQLPTESSSSSSSSLAAESDELVGTRWAVLVAGSSGYGNYRHQADVCHAYQLLRKGGVKEENIVVFMYDDIANNELNPRPGIIINHPQGQDVYAGVPKIFDGHNGNAAAIFTRENLLNHVLDALPRGLGRIDEGDEKRCKFHKWEFGDLGFTVHVGQYTVASYSPRTHLR